MKQRKPMRGAYWTILLVLCVLILGKAIYGFITNGFAETMNSNDGWALIIPIVYFAAYLIVPKLKFLQPIPTDPKVSDAENTPLSTPARLTLVRDNSVAGVAVPTIIHVNGQQVCQLKNGERTTIELRMKHNVLLTNGMGSPNVRCDVVAPDGGNGELHLKSAAFLPKTLKWN